jgi:hypothetical protein
VVTCLLEILQEIEEVLYFSTVLHYFNLESKIVVVVESSNLVVAGILSQNDDNDILHPVAYFSSKHPLAEINYEMYAQEPLAIIWCLSEWRQLLEGSPHCIKVICDH